MHKARVDICINSLQATANRLSVISHTVVWSNGLNVRSRTSCMFYSLRDKYDLEVTLADTIDEIPGSWNGQQCNMWFYMLFCTVYGIRLRA
jgi:hypothetical protein